MPSPKAKGLEELFTDTLKDIYFAEKQILRALPKMAKSASSQDFAADEVVDAHLCAFVGKLNRRVGR